MWVFPFYLLLLPALISASIQDSETCFVSGKCLDSFLLEEAAAMDVYECLLLCKDTPGCGWFTFNPDISKPFCEVFTECNNLNTTNCEHCVSGPRNCSISCDIPGKCRGILIDTVGASSSLECLDHCKNIQKCNWFTFDENILACFLLENCVLSVDESCPSCISGNRNCKGPNKHRNCWEVLEADPSSPDGIYSIDTDGWGPNAPINVYCEMSTAGGGWTVMAYIRSQDQWSINIFDNSGSLGDTEHGFTYGKTLMDSGLQFKEKIIIYLALEEEGESFGRQWMINKWDDNEHLTIDSIRTPCCWEYRDSFNYTDSHVTEDEEFPDKFDYAHLGFFHNNKGIGYMGTQGGNYGCRDGNDICWMPRGFSCNTDGKRCALLAQQGEGVIYAVR